LIRLLDSNYFEHLFNDVGIKKISDDVRLLIDESSLSYRFVTSEEELQIDRIVRHETEIGRDKSVGPHRKELWDRHWSDVYKRFTQTGFELSALNPDFISKTPFLRLDGRYIVPLSKGFELSYYQIIRAIIGASWIKTSQSVFEFGCGSGFNLAYFAKTFPGKCFTGTDWVEGPILILNEMRSKLGLDVHGCLFDLLEPNFDLRLPDNTVVLTLCALEQLGGGFKAFLDYLLNVKPGLVINLEPINDHYNVSIPFDGVAFEYHRARNYLTGYLSELQALHTQQRINLNFSKRLGFGSLLHECYHLTVWEPL
jgi:hypothetical protein